MRVTHEIERACLQPSLLQRASLACVSSSRPLALIKKHSRTVPQPPAILHWEWGLYGFGRMGFLQSADPAVHVVALATQPFFRRGLKLRDAAEAPGKEVSRGHSGQFAANPANPTTRRVRQAVWSTAKWLNLDPKLNLYQGSLKPKLSFNPTSTGRVLADPMAAGTELTNTVRCKIKTVGPPTLQRSLAA